MFMRRTLLTIATLLAILITGGATLMSGSHLSSTLNLLLPEGWEIQTPQGLNSTLYGTTLPQFSLSYQDCPLIEAEQLQIQWWESGLIRLPRATVDYACLASLPSSEASADNQIELAPLLALLPEGEVQIDELHWRNLPASLPLRVQALLNRPSQSRFAFFQQKLTASLRQPQLSLDAELLGTQLQLNAVYQPEPSEQHQLNISVQLSPQLAGLPLRGEADYRWQFSPSQITDPVFRQGRATLHWQQENGQTSGHFQAEFPTHTAYQLKLPFQFDQNRLVIEQGMANLPLPDFPLKAYLNASLYSDRFTLPLHGAVRLSLVSQSEKGKGNLVFNAPNIIFDRQQLSLPLNIHGNLKFGNTILYSAVPLEIGGHWQDLSLKFLPSALLRMNGKARFLHINDLRFPLAGIRLDKSGIHGRLHAIFRGESPDFKQIELHLDGYANNFKAGLETWFQTHISPNAQQGQWNWRFWGHSRFQPLNSDLQLSGRGHWRQDRVQLSEFKGLLSHIQQSGFSIPKTELSLRQPINFAYKQFQLDGAVRLSAPKIAFDYGGELETPQADIAFHGMTENLNLKGHIQAGKLGPITLFARRHLTAQSSELVGRLYWASQPAAVFQSLLPFRSQWLITDGTIKGETAFSANPQRGLIAGGHFAIRQGALSLPSGELTGIHFSLPYQFKQNQFELGKKAPIAVQIAELNLGLPMQDLRVKIDGNYPYHRRKPLYLRELSVKLLGGSLNVQHFALPQTQIAQLNLNQIDLEQILDLAQYHQLHLKGRVNARLPFWLSGNPCYICQGRLEQAARSSLKFTDTLMKAIKQAGYTEQILAYMVNDSHINELNADINVDSTGQMALAAQLHTQLVEQAKTKIHLNYTHRENLFDLWRSIRYGTQLEQKIEHQLYQKMDGQK